VSHFSKQVERHVRKYKKIMPTVAKQSAQEVVAKAQLHNKKGGRMRIDTGFLRASIVAGIGSMPTGQTKGEPDKNYVYTGHGLAATLIRWNPATESLFVGWTANYARAREATDGFMRGASEEWSGIVERVVKKARVGF